LLSRLSSAFSLQRQFMADASHQLRTPLSVIRLTTSVTLEKHPRTEDEYRAALATIDEQGRRLTRLVEDMFRLARADAGRLELHRRPFYLDELLMETARAAAILGAPKDVHVETGPMMEAEAQGDEELVQQMILNLLDNAVKYTGAGGTVRLDMEPEDGFYRIAISDTGMAIPPEDQAHVFDRFYQVNKTDATGAGLGLAIARSIAEAHGGSLVLERSDATVTRFVAKLPALLV
jgi:two-component system OmpR family sensor kinase